jgi:UDP-N-acetylmuramoyl-tripeptide--D-alanyl-D-alanine ligase
VPLIEEYFLVSKKVESSLPTLVVENTQDALSKIATWHLHNIKPKVIPFPPSSLYISYKTIYFHNILMKSFLI